MFHIYRIYFLSCLAKIFLAQPMYIMYIFLCMVGFFFPWTSKKYGGATSAALKNGLMTSTTTPKPYFHGYFLVKALG
ncbi:hypothetical protein HanXRQr2_Chr14g0639241 [Helianthus annuus]|uniref:Uncharacterized protein n=2 Tax=Helianthus annuus TaxID=4232 RepID=A0A9K3H5W9_HELAN|nr:hypothetical protein HanXRQr2_Chr14g0639241 [Helianthus annuus]KAJ0839958.1 hypothetical protein HanPSC8_Chr14g0613041 [Helianthus annuus]